MLTFVLCLAAHEVAVKVMVRLCSHVVALLGKQPLVCSHRRLAKFTPRSWVGGSPASCSLDSRGLSQQLEGACTSSPRKLTLSISTESLKSKVAGTMESQPMGRNPSAIFSWLEASHRSCPSKGVNSGRQRSWAAALESLGITRNINKWTSHRSL